jgi:hypothetical protein
VHGFEYLPRAFYVPTHASLLCSCKHACSRVGGRSHH